MNASITLKSIPAPIYQLVKQAARRHHRSMNNEIIACLSQVLEPQTVDVQDHLLRARELRARYAGPPLGFEQIAQAIDRDRA